MSIQVSAQLIVVERSLQPDVIAMRSPGLGVCVGVRRPKLLLGALGCLSHKLAPCFFSR